MHHTPKTEATKRQTRTRQTPRHRHGRIPEPRTQPQRHYSSMQRRRAKAPRRRRPRTDAVRFACRKRRRSVPRCAHLFRWSRSASAWVCRAAAPVAAPWPCSRCGPPGPQGTRRRPRRRPAAMWAAHRPPPRLRERRRSAAPVWRRRRRGTFYRRGSCPWDWLMVTKVTGVVYLFFIGFWFVQFFEIEAVPSGCGMKEKPKMVWVTWYSSSDRL